MVEGENKVVIELKDKSKKVFKVNLASEKNNASNTENNNASALKAKEISVVKSIYGNVESFAIQFNGNAKDINATLDQIESVSLNGNVLDKASIFAGGFGNFPENSYTVKELMDAYGRIPSLQLSASSVQEGTNRLLVKFTDGKTLSLNFDQDGKILEDEAEEAAKDNHLEVVEKRESRNGTKYFALSFPEMSEEEAAAYLAKLSKVTVNETVYSLTSTPYRLYEKQYFVDKKDKNSTLNAALALTQDGGVKIGENEVVLETKDGESQSYLFTLEALTPPAFEEADQQSRGEVEISFTGKAADINAYLKREQLTVTVNGKKLELQRYRDHLQSAPASGAIEYSYVDKHNHFFIGKDALQAGENTVTISSPDYKEQSFSFTYEK